MSKLSFVQRAQPQLVFFLEGSKTLRGKMRRALLHGAGIAAPLRSVPVTWAVFLEESDGDACESVETPGEGNCLLKQTDIDTYRYCYL